MISVWKKRGIASLLYPLSIGYAMEIGRRNRRFDRRPELPERVPAAVVSVGNITVGGTGKSPLVLTLAEKLRGRGHKVGVVSRGYGRRSHTALTVSDGKNKILNPGLAGDEPVMMASRLNDVPIVVGKDRIEAVKRCVGEFGSQIILLDDGFQYRRLRRDLDIVVIDALQPFGNGWLLPAGPLREPPGSLSRAQMIVLSRSDETGMGLEAIENRVRRYTEAPIFRARHETREWVEVTDGEAHKLKSLRGRFCYAFAGIGNPDAFVRTLKGSGIEVVGFLPFRDHHVYSDSDLDRIFRNAGKKGAVAVVTTEKDAVRLPEHLSPEIPLFFLRVDLQFEEDDDSVLFQIESIL